MHNLFHGKKMFKDGRYGELVGRLRQAVLEEAGVTDVSLRAAVEARAAALGGRAGAAEPGAGEAVPEPVRAFVDKVARHAHLVTDADVEGLRSAGYSEDAIFELAASAVLGAGCGRLERGLSALRGEA
ncbi:MAG TPA: hypothetical protein VMM12_14135 [Longimicrobiales bacterium]|nr:hypothetical protein [Longimicrobiales bacterium]